jgi:hypothetical protein
MATFSEFDTFFIDDERQFLGSVFLRGGDNLEFEGPVSATFSSPDMERGDTFDLLTALSNQSGMDVFVYQGGATAVTQKAIARGILLDLYWRDNSFSELQGVSAYPGIPPRYTIGSYTESVNGIVTNFDFINYRAQAIGRRVVLLDRDPRRPVWGLSDIVTSANFDSRLWEHPISHALTLDLNPGATYDENEGADPPLPPSIVPLTSKLYGRAYIFFYADYEYTWMHEDGTARNSLLTVYSRPNYRLMTLGVGWYGGSGTASV